MNICFVIFKLLPPKPFLHNKKLVMIALVVLLPMATFAGGVQPVRSRFAFVICSVFIEVPLLQKQAAQGSQVVQDSEAGGHLLT